MQQRACHRTFVGSFALVAALGVSACIGASSPTDAVEPFARYVLTEGSTGASQLLPPFVVDSTALRVRTVLGDTIAFDTNAKTYTITTLFRIDSAGVRRTARVVVGPKTYTREIVVNTLTLPETFDGVGNYVFAYTPNKRGALTLRAIQFYYEAR